jgi:hypothetical protein
MNQPSAHNLDARTAELIARQLNSAYMNACGFGIDHPTTARALETFHGTLSTALAKDPSLSLILDRGALFIEKHPVGGRFNPKRLVDSFNEMGLESITFSKGFSEADAKALTGTLSKLLEYPSLDAAEADLRRHQSGTIQFNYIVYRKVTSDQKVVSSSESGEDPGEALKRRKPKTQVTAAGARVLDQLDSFFSLGDLAGDPDAAAERLTSSAGEDNGNRAKLVEHLKKLVREVEMGGGDVEGLAPEELFTAMNTLRQRLHKSVSAHEDVDRIMQGSGEVVSEVDELTYSTLVSLVREEYRGGNFSVQRMAQIINRMLPDAGDLKRLLPRLRKGLIEEGMPIDEYTRLVHELSNELRGEHLVSALEAGAENVGMEVDDIVRQIQEDPTEAARLVVLAGELRQGGVGDNQQLSAAFTDYIERVSQQLALDRFSHGESLDAGTLGDQIARVQKELIGRMNESGLPPDASKQLQQQLEKRMPELRENSKMELFERMLGGSEQLTDTLVLDWLEKQVETPSELEELTRAISERLQRHGYSPQQAASLIDQLANRLDREDEPPRLPPAVLSVNNTALFLKHQVKSAQRYGTPFSVTKLLVEWLVPAGGGTPRRPRKSDMNEILPELYFRIVRLARDLDLVGSLEKSQRAVPFIILPMTEEEGAAIFRQRLLDVLAEFPFRLDGGEYTLACTVTAVGFDTETDKDANTFVHRLNEAHKANRADVARQAAGRAAASRSGGAA